MSNFLKNKNVRITLVNPKTWENYDVYFKLYHTNLAKKWVDAFQQMDRGEKSIREKSIKFSMSATYDIESLSDSGKVERLNQIVNKINSFYDKQIRSVEEINQETLNYLHEEYEIYGIRLDEKLSAKWWDDAWMNIDPEDEQATRWPGIKFNEEFHSDFLQLNDMIHTIELFFFAANHGRDLPGFSPINLLISHNPRIDYEITEEDSASFFKYHQFGDLVLGYNTLGKNLTHIIEDEDYRAAEENAVVLQTYWSNEIMARLEPSDANPIIATEKYNIFKKLGLEKHGWKFNDPANREGYLLIGHMYEVQEDDMYDNEIGMKMDLTPFSSVHSVEIVSDGQMISAYKNSAFRLPSWKKPLPIQGKKIIEIKNEEAAIITWILNDICNYSCRYCPPGLHNGKNQALDWSIVEPFINQLFYHYGIALGKKLQFSLSGGEPTMSPFFPELVKMIYMKGGAVGITTNLVRTPRFVEENFKYLSYAGCSFHPAQEFPNNTTDDWIEKVKIASNLTAVTVRLMMDPLYWDQCIEFIERIRNETTVSLEIVYIDDQYGSSPIKISDVAYSSEQLEFFKTFKKIPSRTTFIQIEKTNTLFKKLEVKGTVMYEDETKESIPTSQTLINRGQTNFFDYTCAIGKESMFIHQTGVIKRGNCNVGGIIGNIQEYDKIDWNSLIKTVLCNSLRCSCGADVPISKRM
jgi:hypothetical protein